MHFYGSHIPIAAEFRPLQKFAFADTLHKFFLGDKMIFSAIFLSRPRLSSRMRDGKPKGIRLALKKSLEEGRFSGTRRAANHKWLLWRSDQCEKRIGSSNIRTRLTTSGLMGLDIVDVRRMVVLESGRRKKIVVFRCNLLRSSMSIYKVLERMICFKKMP